MNTLKVSDIFQNLSFYQDQYQSIVTQTEQYYTVVEDAVLDVWPVREKQLYLGDLLQLWFSNKWLINQPCHLKHSKQRLADLFAPLLKRDDLYLYELHGNAVLGKSHAKVWSVSEQCSLTIELESSLQYYCTYKSLKH